jgi:hypothetical protein
MRSLSYGNADYDVRHNLTADFIWEIPLKSRNRAINGLLGRWSIAGRVNAHTGFPFSVYNSQLAGRLLNFGGFALADGLSPTIRSTCGDSSVDVPCFTATQFGSVATQTDLGNMQRNSFRGPGYFNIDSSVYKTIVIGERPRLRIGAAAYNLLNHPNFASPAGDVSRPGLGLITATGVPPSGPYGSNAGPSGRAVVIMGRLDF